MLLIWLQFFISASVIIIAGTKLSLYADVISEKTGLSKAWIGMILLGVVTSLPEAVTSLASAVKINAPDLSLGNVLGSNTFNLIIIILLGFLHKPGSVINRANPKHPHILSAVLTIILSAIVIAGIFINTKANVWSICNIGIDSMAIVFVYIVGMRLIFKSESKEIPAQLIDKELTLFRYKGTALSKAYTGFIITAGLTVVSAIWLAGIGEEIAKVTGLGRTFVGSVFLAIVTSFPEIVVSVAALKLGSIDLAFGNILGSNMFNLFIIPITDIAYRKGALLAFVSQGHLLTASLGIFLTCVGIIGVTRHVKRKKGQV